MLEPDSGGYVGVVDNRVAEAESGVQPASGGRRRCIRVMLQGARCASLWLRAEEAAEGRGDDTGTVEIEAAGIDAEAFRAGNMPIFSRPIYSGT